VADIARNRNNCVVSAVIVLEMNKSEALEVEVIDKLSVLRKVKANGSLSNNLLRTVRIDLF